MKRILPLAAILVLALLLITACGGADTPAPAPATAPPAATEAPAATEPATAPPVAELPPEDQRWTPNELGPATVRMAWWGADARHEAVNAALDLFESRYQNVSIERDYGAFGGYLDSLVVQMAGQAEADIIQVNYAWVHSLGGGVNVFQDLNQMSDIIDLNQWSPALRGFTTTADGQLSGVPHGITGRVIVYDTEVYEPFGGFPATFDEWIAIGEEIAAGNLVLDQGDNTYGFFPIGPETMDIVMLTMLYNHTGRNLQADGNILFTVEEVEYMFNIWQRMIDTGALPTWDQQEGVADVFNPVWMEGRGGSEFPWVGNIFVSAGAFLDNEPSEGIVEGMGVALLPAVQAGQSRNSMQRPSLVHVVSRNSNHPELAAYLLNFLYTDEEALLILGNAFGIPLSTDAARIFEREGGAWGLQLDGFDLLEANMGTMCPLFEDPNLRPQRFAAIEAFRTGSIDAAEAARRWVENQQQELNAMR